MLISSVAALCTLGFAPIVRFLSVTQPEDGSKGPVSGARLAGESSGTWPLAPIAFCG